MAGSLGFGRQYCIPKGKASAEYRFVGQRWQAAQKVASAIW
jgi:hypothetical protein